jgi:hypothetical protein
MTRNVNIFALIIFLLLPGTVFAANHYIRSGATGSNNGSDWTNAWTSIPSTLTRGDTYYIADGTYGSYKFDDVASGTIVITIKKATASDHGTGTGWDSTYGDGQATFTSGITISTGYWVIDGVSRTNATTGHGFVIDTRSSHGKGAIVTNAANSTLRYVAFIGGGPDGSSYSNDLIYELGGATNFTFQYCYFYNAGRCHGLTRGGDNWLIEYSYFDTNESTEAQHSESWSCVGSSNWTVRYNTFANIEGTGVLVVGDGGGWKVYGNVFRDIPDISNSIFGGWTAEYMQGGYFYNNTVLNSTVGRVGWSNDTGLYSYNNIFINASNMAFGGEHTHNYNAFSGTNAYGEANAKINLTTSIFQDYANRDLRLSVATDGGNNTIGSEYNTDPLGTTRGSDGTWDRGAFEYTGGGGNEPPPADKIPLSPAIISIQ